MFSTIRKRMSFANVAVTLALVFAMTGGAYAASRYVITSTKQISPKVLKSLQGKAGKAGVNGTQGPAGSVGAQGPQGPAGAKGETGAAGGPGAKGENGAPGTPGKNGTTGFTKTLPSGSTETGTWTISSEALPYVATSISLPIPLAAPIEIGPPTGPGDCAHGEDSKCRFHYINKEGKELTETNEEVTSTQCTGNAEEPTAKPGQLCVYETLAGGVKHAEHEGVETNTPETHIYRAGGDIFGHSEQAEGVATSGALLLFKATTPGVRFGFGTWAVTAP